MKTPMGKRRLGGLHIRLFTLIVKDMANDYSISGMVEKIGL